MRRTWWTSAHAWGGRGCRSPWPGWDATTSGCASTTTPVGPSSTLLFDEGITFFDTAGHLRRREVRGGPGPGARRPALRGDPRPPRAGMASREPARTARAAAAGTSSARWSRACGGCARTTSISTSSTSPTRSRPSRRPSEALERPRPPGQGALHRQGWSNFAGWQVADADWSRRASSTSSGSCRCRTSGACSTGPSRPEVVPGGPGVRRRACCPTSRLASGVLTGQVHPRRGVPRGHPPGRHGHVWATWHPTRTWPRSTTSGPGPPTATAPSATWALSWLASQPVVSSVIAGASAPSR